MLSTAGSTANVHRRQVTVRTGFMTPEILEAASRELTLTVQDVSNLKALARGG